MSKNDMFYQKFLQSKHLLFLTLEKQKEEETDNKNKRKVHCFAFMICSCKQMYKLNFGALKNPKKSLKFLWKFLEFNYLFNLCWRTDTFCGKTKIKKTLYLIEKSRFFAAEKQHCDNEYLEICNNLDYSGSEIC